MIDQRLIHYSAADSLLPLYTRAQPIVISPYDKPNGLWVSVVGEMDWKEWCEAEGFIHGSQFAYEVRLSPGAKIKMVNGAQELDMFTEHYGVTTRYGRGIDWPRVAESYQGIIIAPYVWGRRMGMGADWYYPWDCASGCIWDPAAICKVVSLGTVEFTAHSYDE